MTSWKNQLYFGDNLEILRDYIAPESVDLVYLDPPFNSQATYNMLFKESDGQQAAAQVQAFKDFWHWEEAAPDYHEVVQTGPPQVAKLLSALHDFLGHNDMMAYLAKMAIRLVELHRVLKPTGSLYLHCDPTASHYLKMLLDSVFGPLQFRNHVTWKRSDAHNDARRQFGWISDHILVYGGPSVGTFNVQYQGFADKTLREWYQWLEFPDGSVRRMTKEELDTQEVPPGARRFNTDNLTSPSPRPNLTYDYKGFKPHHNGWKVSYEKMVDLDERGLLLFPSKPDGRIMRKRYLDEQPGAVVGDVWTDISQLRGATKERLGYPTQKPEALLERIITASSNEGDLVLDPFCGCGTTIAVAERLHRRWIGIDITHLAIALMKTRLDHAFGPDLTPYEVIGEPMDLESARALFRQDPYQFEYWALSLVKARPAGEPKKGADKGIDGWQYFFDDDSGQAKRIVIEVKGGHVSVPQVGYLIAAAQREKAELGVFLTLEPSTKPMRDMAADAGMYQAPGLQEAVPRIQILTIEELLGGKTIQLPPTANATFKRAPRQFKAKPKAGQRGLPEA